MKDWDEEIRDAFQSGFRVHCGASESECCVKRGHECSEITYARVFFGPAHADGVEKYITEQDRKRAVWNKQKAK